MVDVSTCINLIKEFFQIGLFSFGGGYATLPFLYKLTQVYNWYTPQELAQMIAVATLTPGPVGINVATYSGMKVGGVLTAFIATFSEICPALIIGIGISKLLKTFRDNFYIKSALWALKPVSCALLSYVALKLFYGNIIRSPHVKLSAILFFAFLGVSLWKQKDPLWYISLTAGIGIVFVSAGLI